MGAKYEAKKRDFERKLRQRRAAELANGGDLGTVKLPPILHGGVLAINALKRRYERVCFVDGSPFFKTVNRRELTVGANGLLVEGPAPRVGRQDELLIKNILARRADIIRRITRPSAA